MSTTARLTAPIIAMGRPALATLADMGAATLFLAQALGNLLRHGTNVVEVVRQVSQLGLRCIIPVLLVVAPMGALIALEGHLIVTMFGVDRLLAPLVAISVTREVAPGFSALMIAMQAGGALAAELGAMRVRGEIDACDTMAVDSITELVTPRLIAGAIVTPLINLIAVVCGIGAAYGVAVYRRGMPAGAFVDNSFEWLRSIDLWGGELKATIFGLLITATSCYQGYHARGGAVGVGEAANRAVVQAIVIIPVANYVINSALYAGAGQ